MKYLQYFLYFAINGLFIAKYFPRVNVDPFLSVGVYLCLFCVILFVWYKVQNRVSEASFKCLTYTLLALSISAIVFLLSKIEPLDVRVDRWSATTYFLDGLFSGVYPYGIHTHVSTGNFPSPFPLWHYINIPFWILGDVGLGLIFFLLATVFMVYYYTNSYQKVFLFLLLLLLSPAYWWEVIVRSDGLSNALLVFCAILFLEKKHYSFSKNWWALIVLCGCIASTRLSAVIPMALYLFQPYLIQSWKRIILFPLCVLCLVLLFFAPYILWDTQTWMFFNRNPFMSQTSIGSPMVLFTMIILAIYLALKSKNFMQMINFISIFLFLFILVSQISLIIVKGIGDGFFENSIYDISYYTLALPYCIFILSSKQKNGTKQ